MSILFVWVFLVLKYCVGKKLRGAKTTEDIQIYFCICVNCGDHRKTPISTSRKRSKIAVGKTLKIIFQTYVLT